jgi:hypothetical protein
MSYTNDLVENAKRRAHDLTWNTTIDVLEATEEVTDTGVDVSYSPGETGIQARYAEPNPDADRDEGGTDVDLDAIYYVRDDIGTDWRDFGDSGEAATRIDDTETGQRFEVRTVVDARDGRVKLGCVEV